MATNLESKKLILDPWSTIDYMAKIWLSEFAQKPSTGYFFYTESLYPS